jgi:hypothetical protein
MRALDDRTPAEAAQDADMRIRVLAAILLLETRFERVGDGNLNSIREELGLPAAEPIDPTGLDVRAIPFVRFWRLQPERLQDQDLLVLWRTAVGAKMTLAATAMAREIVGRESLQKHNDRVSALGMLAEAELDADRRLALIDEARSNAEANDESSAPWDLRELVERIRRGEVEEIQRLASHIVTAHRGEAGVEQKLFEILNAAGLVRPSGAPVGAAAGAPQGLAVPATAGSEPGKIWTPDQETESAQGGKKPGIWTPGMD